jgi:DNA excision repair protein ERCC-3
MRYDPNRPLVVQKDLTVLLEARHADYEQARERLARFAELVKSPEHLHTYRMTPLSLWNAAASGIAGEEIIRTLEQYAKFPLPAGVAADIRRYVSRYGMLRLERLGGDLLLVSDDTSCCARLPVTRRCGGIS